MLNVYSGLPEGFLAAKASDLQQLLGGPSLIEIVGRREPPLFVSILLHGNETTGLDALQLIFNKYRERELPRTILLFVGNVAAARRGLRKLPEQPDMNRVWPGTALPDSPEKRLAAEVIARVKSRGCFAAIDIHNNTGLNPHYGCVNKLDGPYLQLAALFSRTVVYFTRPHGVLSLAMAKLCPATTIECGQAGSPGAAEHAAELVDAALHLATIQEHPPREIDIYHTVGAVRVPSHHSFGFGGEREVDLHLTSDLELYNFRDLPAGTLFAWTDPARGAFFSVEDNEGREAAADFFVRDGDSIRLRRPAMPAMLAVNEKAIRDDVLCYLMERLPHPYDASKDSA
ncbi:M14 family metallopeptidase [Halorhodospira halochloris]|uniref:Succinylglutamate desuccinylase/aspartoacylase n=1 Tax=Halorhodospira halochloris TaxID=1052 RepID=A0A110B4V0_HALHR|nr:M14 family metallopeptidase [Halorhodospira halochloris]MBK1650988.1 peptidase M14 [Halorhodospira halochloris]MCG5529355.1 M14 family metallopeptidase [Halorhodospira halochloris]MCG5547330.1 M14 family metallopeptidase [Halorhodospira halochloris]BAU56502.1 succinylglutamate desuccinylase/aspartoacylase [Halorhodospira halochloris]